MTDCLFCKIVAGEIPAEVVRDEARTLACADLSPQAPTHVLVITKDHHANAAEVAAADPALLGEVVATAHRVAVAAGVAESGYRLVFNTGDYAGQTVYHVHLHVLGGEPLGRFGTPAP